MSAQCLFDLLQSLEGETTDILDILELVKAEKPLKSLGKYKTVSNILFRIAIVQIGICMYIQTKTVV